MRKTLLYLVSVVLLLQTAFAADLQLKWSELSGTVLDHDVQLVLPNGTALRGIAMAVREDSLILNVQKTSDGKAYPKGQVSIPRASVSVLNVRRTRGAAGRTIGTVAGTLGGLVASGEWIGHTHSISGGAAIAIVLGVTTGIATAGYFAGRSVDERLTVIHVAP